MKTEALAPKPPAESSGNNRTANRDAKDTQTDLFALLLSAAEGDKPATAAQVTDPQEPAQYPPALASLLPPRGPEVPKPHETETPLALPLEGLGLKLGTTPTPQAKPDQPRTAATPEMGAPGQWVSTVAKARPRTDPSPLLTEMVPSLPASEAAQGLVADPLRSAWHAAGGNGHPPGMLAERLGEPESLDLSALSASGAERSGEQREGGQGQRGELARVLLESAGQVRSTQTEGAAVRSFADLMGDAMGGGMDQAFEQLGSQISFWAAGQTRKASLMLHAGLREAMEVDVSLQGDKAELAFRTDDLQTREALRAHAHTLLADMLSRAGLGLESLSVGGRDAGQSGESSRGRDGAPDRPTGKQPDNPAEATRLLRQQPGVGLSVYA